MIPIEAGISIENSGLEIEELKSLERMGIISLQDEEYIRCKNCKDLIDIRDFNHDRIIKCPNCDNTVGKSSSVIKKTAIAKVKFKKIVSIVNSQICTTFGNENVSYDEFDRSWIILHDAKKYLIFVYGISTVSSFLSISENEGVILYLNEKKIRSQIHNLNKSRYRYIFDPVFSSPDHFKDYIDSLNFDKTQEYLKFKEKFEKFLLSMTDTKFEKDFIPKFIEGIIRNYSELSKLYTRLQQVENTILNTKYLKMGGSGLEDFHFVNLLNYLQDGLMPEKFGEAKRYNTSHFSYALFSVALTHAHFEDSLFFVTTNDIAPSVWDTVISQKREGHYKFVILDKDLMLMLIINLKLQYLIDLDR